MIWRITFNPVHFCTPTCTKSLVIFSPWLDLFHRGDTFCQYSRCNVPECWCISTCLPSRRSNPDLTKPVLLIRGATLRSRGKALKCSAFLFFFLELWLGETNDFQTWCGRFCSLGVASSLTQGNAVHLGTQGVRQVPVHLLDDLLLDLWDGVTVEHLHGCNVQTFTLNQHLQGLTNTHGLRRWSGRVFYKIF